ncbi:hypothetical protein HM1_0410 [Heliomicrobium modesticaldum Ice1]|uniref:Uncharacterized protein n=1 Tax=Heliobacterium modesticaldum (strain ATCC 51547 / Ice1) TaxID=498761 RepID=B0TF44_HELMI|nr:hypothetical protein HM1_0410 [Heliomicrobium modesticaldum Ice1]
MDLDGRTNDTFPPGKGIAFFRPFSCFDFEHKISHFSNIKSLMRSLAQMKTALRRLLPVDLSN